MKSANTFAREQRPVERYSYKSNSGTTNPLRPRKAPPKKPGKYQQPEVTKGDWHSTGTSIVSDSGETIAMAWFGLSTNLPQRRRDMRMLANAKKLDALARTLLNVFPDGSDDMRIVALLEQAKEAIGT